MKKKRARPNPSTGLDTKLRALVKFAGMKLGGEDGEHPSLTPLFEQIFGATKTKHFALWAMPEWKLTKDGAWIDPGDLSQLQADVGALLADIIEDRTLTNRVQPGAKVIMSRPIGRLATTLGVTTHTDVPGRHALSIVGPARDVFLTVVCHLLALTPTGKILKCPECGAIFYKVRRQTHCSSTCYDTSYWRERYPEKKKLAARKRWYEANGWTLGARSKRKARLITKSAAGVAEKRARNS